MLPVFYSCEWCVYIPLIFIQVTKRNASLNFRACTNSALSFSHKQQENFESGIRRSGICFGAKVDSSCYFSISERWFLFDLFCFGFNFFCIGLVWLLFSFLVWIVVWFVVWFFLWCGIFWFIGWLFSVCFVLVVGVLLLLLFSCFFKIWILCYLWNPDNIKDIKIFNESEF